MTRARSFLTFAVCLLPFVLLGDAQQTPPVFRAGVDIVQLDVSVLDRERKPVRGLTMKDFEVFENGRAQPVVAFSAVDVPDSEEPSAAWMREVTPDVRTNSLEERRLFVLVLDDAMMPFYPPIIKAAKEIAREVINRLGPADLAAVVFTRDNRNTQDFTGDRARLLAAVEKFSGGFAFQPPVPPPDAPGSVLKPPNMDAYFYRSSISTLGSVAKFLTDVPERRKALVYVSVGVPVDPEMLAPSGDSGTLADRGMYSGLVDEMAEAFRQAQRANVNIYGMDPSGLDGLTAYFQTIRPPPTTSPALFREFLRTVAENTGGRAVVDTNEFTAGVAQMFRENSSYYLLGFFSTNPAADGKLRRLEVRVNQPGLTVRAREGYYAPAPAKSATAEKPAPTPLVKALAGLLPNPEMAMRVSLAPFAAAGTKDATVAIVLGLRQPPPSAAPGVTRVVEEVDLQVTAFTPEGQPRATSRQTARVTLRANVGNEALYEVLAKMTLKPGRYQLRLAAHNKSRGKTGSVYADVDVPDFSSDAVSLSGIVLGVTPALIAAPKDALATLLPIVPTSQRDLWASHQVRAFVRAYQGGRAPVAPVNLTIRILDRQDSTVFEHVETLGLDRFRTNRAADYQLELPVARLTAGPHVLRLEATLASGASARRDLSFVMR